MFRSKDAATRWRRRDKRYNPNKDKNQRSRPTERGMTHGWLKGVQQVLRLEHGVGVHKSELRGIEEGDPIADLVSGIATRGEYPPESALLHDMTRWRRSKEATRRRRAERDAKPLAG